MKNRYKPLFISLLTLLAALCLGVFALAAPVEDTTASSSKEVAAPLSEQFSDLSYSENEVSLAYMIDHGFIAGFSDGSFRPARAYTRLELAQLVTTLCELETASGYKSSFTDCVLSDTAAIDAAVSNGLMTGRSGQTFDPYGSVLKAEMLGTLEKAAAYLELEGFYEHADGYTAWRNDYTLCTADDAMLATYPLALALQLRAEAEVKAAETEATAEAVAELTGKDGAASGEATDDTEVETETETTTEESTETTTAQTSGEPSGEVSNEPEKTTDTTTATDATPPAGVTAPAPTAQPTVTPAATAAPTPEPEDEADGLRNDIKDKYADIRDSIIAFLRDLFGG